MSKKTISLFVTMIFMLSLVACGGSGDGEKVDAPKPSEPPVATETPTDIPTDTSGEAVDAKPESGNLVVNENIVKGDIGVGPVVIESEMGDFTIPEGLNYQLYYAPAKGEEALSTRVDFGVGNTSTGFIEISTTRMIASLDDAVQECIRMQGVGTRESVIGDEVTYGDVTYKMLTITDPEYKKVEYFLVTYFKSGNGRDGYVELNTSGGTDSYSMAIDDPIVVEMLENIVLK